MTNPQGLSPEFKYLRDVLGLQSVITDQNLSVEAPVAGAVSAEIVVWTPELSDAERELFYKIIKAVELSTYKHIETNDSESADWLSFGSALGLAFGSPAAEIKSEVQWTYLPSLQQMISSDQAIKYKKQAWETLKKFKLDIQ